MEKIFYTNISHFSKIEICFPEMHLGKVKKKIRSVSHFQSYFDRAKNEKRFSNSISFTTLVIDSTKE